MRIVFACVHSAGRSQMAAAWLNALAQGSGTAVSAGTEPAIRIHPEVVAAMSEVGIDLSDAKPQLLTAKLLADATHLITLGCGEQCPVIPRWVRHEDWPLEDPRGKPLARVREIRDEIRGRVEQLIAQLDGPARQAQPGK